MDTTLIDARIDRALAANARAEKVIIGLAIAIFVFGMAAMLLAYWKIHPAVGAGASAFQLVLVYPITEIRRLRRENVSLQTVPVLVAGFPPDRAMDEVAKLLAFIRGETPKGPVFDEIRRMGRSRSPRTKS